MALPPLPDNNTARWFIGYTTGRKNHEFIVRAAAGVGATTVDARVRAFLDALAPVVPQNWAITGIKRQDAGAEFSLPASLTNVGGFSGENGEFLVPANQEPRQVNFVGRSLVSGRQVRVGVFGLIGITPDDYRLNGTEFSNTIGPAIAALTAASQNGVFVAIDGANVLWKDYANVNYNSYWEADARG